VTTAGATTVHTAASQSMESMGDTITPARRRATSRGKCEIYVLLELVDPVQCNDKYIGTCFFDNGNCACMILHACECHFVETEYMKSQHTVSDFSECFRLSHRRVQRVYQMCDTGLRCARQRTGDNYTASTATDFVLYAPRRVS
jgi:hypothetical protein